MKKVIERMNNSVVAEQLARDAKSGSVSPSAATAAKEKKKWFSRKASGSSKEAAAAAAAAENDEEPEGMRVDFYLVVFLKFIASIVPTIEVDSTTSF
jgi:ubiquitin-like-conjugating enzyme ATG3